MKLEIAKLTAAIEKLREAILFLAEKMSAKEAQHYGISTNHLETILPSTLTSLSSGASKFSCMGGPKTTRQAKNDPANETALMAIFRKFYVEYPKHVGRGAAIRALRGALKIATAEQIIDGAKKHAVWCKENGADFKYIPHPATWLNQQRWLDYPHLVEDGSLIAARIEKLRIGLQRARARGDSKAAEAISDALDSDINKMAELTQTKC